LIFYADHGLHFIKSVMLSLGSDLINLPSTDAHKHVFQQPHVVGNIEI